MIGPGVGARWKSREGGASKPRVRRRDARRERASGTRPQGARGTGDPPRFAGGGGRDGGCRRPGRTRGSPFAGRRPIPESATRGSGLRRPAPRRGRWRLPPSGNSGPGAGSPRGFGGPAPAEPRPSIGTADCEPSLPGLGPPSFGSGSDPGGRPGCGTRRAGTARPSPSGKGPSTGADARERRSGTPRAPVPPVPSAFGPTGG